MFERNRVDNVEQNTAAAVAVEITTGSSEVLTGRLFLPAGRSLFDVLNSAGSFLEFEAYGGERTYIAKAAVRNVRLVGVTRAQSLAVRVRDLDGFDPYTILGVPANATFDDVKVAWHRLSKRYHPDCFANVALPDEVAEYLSVMARRVNAAFQAIETAHLSRRRAAEALGTPVGRRT